jgi:hypothetical protein
VVWKASRKPLLSFGGGRTKVRVCASTCGHAYTRHLGVTSWKPDGEETMRTNSCKWQYVLRAVAVACAAFFAAVTTNAADKGSNAVVIRGGDGPPQAQARQDAVGETFAPDVQVALGAPWLTRDNLSFGAVTESSDGEESASELNRKLSNPVSSIWSISNQFNNFELNNGQWSNNWNFQPVLPIGLTKDWNLITRPVMPFYNIVPHETRPNEFARDAGLGDLTLLELISPANSGNWVLGAGPTAIFPTATSVFTGQGKWQLGPSVVVGYLTKQYFIGVFPQQWWSIGGEHFRADTNQMNLQPIATLFFREGWSFGYSGNILADWTAPSPDVWTVPIGLGLGKVVKFGRLPVKIQLAVQYMPVHPRISGQEWNVQLQVTPVIPKLIKGVLFQ